MGRSRRSTLSNILALLLVINLNAVSSTDLQEITRRKLLPIPEVHLDTDEFYGDEIIFMDGVRKSMQELLLELTNLDNPPEMKYNDDSFNIFQDNKKLSMLDIGALCGVNISYVWPSKVDLGNRNQTFEEILRNYADDSTTNEIYINYENDKELIYNHESIISRYDFYKLIFESDNTYIYDHSEWLLDGEKLTSTDVLSLLKQMPDFIVSYRDNKYKVEDFIRLYFSIDFRGRYKIIKNKKSVEVRKIIHDIKKYTVFNNITFGDVDVDIESIIASLRNVKGLTYEIAGLKFVDNQSIPTRAQFLLNNKIFGVHKIIDLLNTVGLAVLGNMNILNDLKDVIIGDLYGKKTYTLEEFKGLNQNTNPIYTVIKDGKTLTNSDINNLLNDDDYEIMDSHDISKREYINLSNSTEKDDKNVCTPYPKFVVNGNILEPEDIIEILCNENPNDIKILYAKNIYKPLSYKILAPEKPQCFELTIDGQIIEAKKILDYIPLEKTHPAMPHLIYMNKVYTPRQMLKLLSSRNPHRLIVRYEENDYSPKEFLQQYPSLPISFRIMKSGKLVPNEKLGYFIPFLRRPGKVNYNDGEYSAQELVSELAYENPNNMKFKFARNSFSPEALQEACLRINPDFELTQDNDTTSTVCMNSHVHDTTTVNVEESIDKQYTDNISDFTTLLTTTEKVQYEINSSGARRRSHLGNGTSSEEDDDGQAAITTESSTTQISSTKLNIPEEIDATTSTIQPEIENNETTIPNTSDVSEYTETYNKSSDNDSLDNSDELLTKTEEDNKTLSPEINSATIGDLNATTEPNSSINEEITQSRKSTEYRHNSEDPKLDYDSSDEDQSLSIWEITSSTPKVNIMYDENISPFMTIEGDNLEIVQSKVSNLKENSNEHLNTITDRENSAEDELQLTTASRFENLIEKEDVCNNKNHKAKPHKIHKHQHHPHNLHRPRLNVTHHSNKEHDLSKFNTNKVTHHPHRGNEKLQLSNPYNEQLLQNDRQPQVKKHHTHYDQLQYDKQPQKYFRYPNDDYEFVEYDPYYDENVKIGKYPREIKHRPHYVQPKTNKHSQDMKYHPTYDRLSSQKVNQHLDYDQLLKDKSSEKNKGHSYYDRMQYDNQMQRNQNHPYTKNRRSYLTTIPDELRRTNRHSITLPQYENTPIDMDDNKHKRSKRVDTTNFVELFKPYPSNGRQRRTRRFSDFFGENINE